MLPIRSVVPELQRVTVRGRSVGGGSATAWVVPGSGHAGGPTGPLVERIGRWASATING